MTTDKNTGSVHDSDAMAYETPKPKRPRTLRSRRPRFAFGKANESSNPPTMAKPSRVTATPTTSASHGIHDVSDWSPRVIAKPATPKTATKPSDTIAPTRNAVRTAAAADTSSLETPRKYER